jgi:hypothetical protein
VREASGLLDDAVDGLGAAVGDAPGGEVGEDFGSPLPKRPAEPGDLLDGAGVEGVEELLGLLAATRRRRGVVDPADCLVDRPGEFDFPVRVADG